jgi:hypothetical protein
VTDNQIVFLRTAFTSPPSVNLLLKSTHGLRRYRFQILAMDARVNSEPSQETIEPKVNLDTTSSMFSLPFRVPVQPTHPEPRPPSVIRKTESQNSEEDKDHFTMPVINKYSANRFSLTISMCKICGKKATNIIHAASSTHSTTR